MTFSVYSAETGYGDGGYSRQEIESGTWAVIGSQYNTATRIYTVTKNEMIDLLVNKGKPIPNDEEKLLETYLEFWDYENMDHISITGSPTGDGEVKLYLSGSNTGQSFQNSSRLKKLVPYGQPTSADGFGGWYAGIENGMYGLDKLFSMYDGSTLQQKPAPEQGQPYESDYEIYNEYRPAFCNLY